jgi:carbon storage regulator
MPGGRFFPRRARERIVVMLVLSRKKNESIVINNDITIVVVEIRGDKVRLGVEAPKEVPVHRREVYDAIKRNAAVQSNTVQGGSPTTEAGSNTAAQS